MVSVELILKTSFEQTHINQASLLKSSSTEELLYYGYFFSLLIHKAETCNKYLSIFSCFTELPSSNKLRLNYIKHNSFLSSHQKRSVRY